MIPHINLRRSAVLTWQLVLWGIAFLGETHGWVVARVAEAWAVLVSIAGYLVAVGLGVQILVAVAYIAVGVLLALHAKPVPAGRLSWYDRVAIAVLWLPALAVVLGWGLVMVVYTIGAMVAFYAGAFGLVLLPYKAVIRGVLYLVR